ncbi:hypothetical protein TNCV_894171 [Trichonephila clavipes]|nr:hypothetical protein TNCV_894171 [Trichonephila clavipes]
MEKEEDLCIKAGSFSMIAMFNFVLAMAFPSSWSDRCSVVIKVTDSWLACHEFEPSTTKDPKCRGEMHVESVESSNVLPLVRCES